MSRFTAGMDSRRAVQRVESLTPALRAELRDALEIFVDHLRDAARRGAPVKSGAYLKSIQGIVYESKNAIFGVVRAGSHEAWYAHILEYGAELPARLIPKNGPLTAGRVMHFVWRGEEIFARRVTFPGARLPERNVLTGPYRSMRQAIEGKIREAADRAASRS